MNSGTHKHNITRHKFILYNSNKPIQGSSM